jgi:hypothetical protein
MMQPTWRVLSRKSIPKFSGATRAIQAAESIEITVPAQHRARAHRSASERCAES